MRILLLNSQLLLEPSAEGISSYVLCLGRGLVGRGHEVHVLSCLSNKGERDYTESGLSLHVRPRYQLPILARQFKMRFSSRRLEGGLSTHRAYRHLGLDFDVVESPDVAAEGLPFALQHRIPLVVRLHGGLAMGGRFFGFEGNLDYLIACTLERWTAEHADVVTSPSRYTLEQFRRLGWLSAKECEIIPNPVDWPTWQNVGPARDTKQVILYVGRLDRLKAPELAVEATVELRKAFPAARIILIGNETDTSDGEPYRKFLSRLAGSGGGCEFVDPVPRHELPLLIERARVVVVTSKSDTFPMVALEAMASGRPVVSTDTTGVADFIRTTGAGQVVHGRNPKELAEALGPFLDDPELAGSMGLRAREAVKRLLDPSRIAQRMEETYRQAIRIHSERRLAL